MVKFICDISHENRGLVGVGATVVVCCTTVPEPNLLKNPTTLFAKPFKNPPSVARFTTIDSARLIRDFINRFFFSFPKYFAMSSMNVVFSSRLEILSTPFRATSSQRIRSFSMLFAPVLAKSLRTRDRAELVYAV